MKFVNDEIMFRAWPSAKLSINISDVQELKLSDGTMAFENGTLKESEEKIRQYIKMVILSHTRNDSEVIMNYFAVLILIFLAYGALLELKFGGLGFDFNYNNANN